MKRIILLIVFTILIGSVGFAQVVGKGLYINGRGEITKSLRLGQSIHIGDSSFVGKAILMMDNMSLLHPYPTLITKHHICISNLGDTTYWNLSAYEGTIIDLNADSIIPFTIRMEWKNNPSNFEVYNILSDNGYYLSFTSNDTSGLATNGYNTSSRYAGVTVYDGVASIGSYQILGDPAGATTQTNGSLTITNGRIATIGSIAYTPADSVFIINPNDGILSYMLRYQTIRVRGNGPITILAATSIQIGQDIGQLISIWCTSDTNTVTFTDSPGVLNLENGVPITLGEGDLLQLQFLDLNGIPQWYEVARKDN